MKSFILFTLIFAYGPAFGGTLKRCQKAKEEAPANCNKEGIKAAQKEAADAQKASGCGKNVKNCAGSFSGVGAGGFNAYQTALGTCDQMATICNTECKPDEMEADQKVISQMKKLNKECQKQIKDAQSEIAKGAAQSKGAEGGGDKTEQAAKEEKPAGGAPPAGATPTPPKSEDEAKKEEPTPQPQAAAPAPAAPQQEKDKEGKAGIDDKAKEQSANGPCTGAKFMCGGCPGFLQKCPGGNPTTCMAKWSDADRKNYDANCGGSSTPATQALTNPSTPQSLGGAAPMSAGGGGAGSTVSGGANTAAMLDDGKKNDKEERGGHKEGGSMGVESAGGGGGGGSDSFSSNPFGSDDSSSSALGGLAGMKTMSSSLANAFSASQNATSGVLDRTGPNLFSIQEAAFAERCKRNLLYHCPNRK